MISAASSAEANCIGIRSNTGRTGSGVLDSSSTSWRSWTSCQMFVPKPVKTSESELPTGSMFWVMLSLISARRLFESCRTSTLGKVTTVVISVAGSSANRLSSSGRTYSARCLMFWPPRPVAWASCCTTITRSGPDPTSMQAKSLMNMMIWKKL